jgi:hypothetical protein
MALAGCALAGWDGFSGGAPLAPEAGTDGPRTEASPPDVQVEDTGVDAPPGTISFVQVNYSATNGATPTKVTVPYLQAQSVGNLNVIIVGWYNTVTVTSVTDSSGNKYRLATGPAMAGTGNNLVAQSIYYASGIATAAPNANVVTVQFSDALDGYDVRVLEYGGADKTEPLDVAVMNMGTGATAMSGSITTRGASELLVHGGTTSQEFTVAPPMFTSRVITTGSDIASDRTAPTPGSYTADAPLSQSGNWVVQVAAFH